MPSEGGSCSISWCDRPRKGKSFCNAHYQRSLIGSDMNKPFQRYASKGKKCSLPDCNNPHSARGYCNKHYSTSRSGVQRGTQIAPAKGMVPCEVEGCVNWVAPNSLSMCQTHRIRKKRGASLSTPVQKRVGPGNWSKWHKDSHGYMIRYRYYPDKSRDRQVQHRVVMEEKVGRPLLKHENVHHVNGVRDDNRPENLELWSTSQPYGQRVEDKIVWAVKILKENGILPSDFATSRQ